MSTKIVDFPDNDDVLSISDTMIGHGALQLYVALSVPLMLLTFVGWYFMRRYESSRIAKHSSSRPASSSPKSPTIVMSQLQPSPNGVMTRYS